MWGALAVGAVSSIALGALLGLLWERLAPRVALVVAGDGKPYPEGYQPEEFMSDDGIAAILCVLGGLLIGACVALIARRMSSPDQAMRWSAIVVVPLGALGTAALWFVGTHLGSFDLNEVVLASDVGDAVTAPLRLRMPGVLVLWPAASALVVFFVAVGDWLADRSRRRQWERGSLTSAG